MKFNPALTLKELNISWNILSWDLVDEHLMSPGKCMEINCAFGNTTRYHILPELHRKSTIIGTDSSEVMIDYTRRKFMNDERIDFDILDIQTKNLQARYIAEFDHIFSYPTLHSRNDIQQEFQNVFDMLKPEGCFHMAIVVTHDAFRLYNRMEKHPVYGKYFKKYSSPFHYAINPGEDLKRLLRNVGFTVKYCRIKSDMEYEVDYLLSYILFGLPFINELPLEQADDLKEKLTTRFDRMEKMINRQNPNNPDYEGYHSDLYEIIEIHACKPSHIIYV